MKKQILFLVIILLSCFSCRSTKIESTNESKQVSLQDTYKAKAELKDSSYIEKDIKAPAPKEKSETRGLQKSYLATSLAYSHALIDSTGVLWHTIQNRDSIPSKQIYIKVYINNTDTIYVAKTDTIYITKTETKTVTNSLADKIQTGALYLLVTVVIVASVFLFIKFK